MRLIVPVRPGDSNEELRYAIRSWETYLALGELEIWTVGYCPTWLSPDHHIEGNRSGSAPVNVFDNIMIASEASMDEEEVIYMNDDFFCLDPVGKVLPVRRNISLAKHRAIFPPRTNQWWPKSLEVTLSWLQERGYSDPHSYEVHRPLPASPSVMFKSLSAWEHGLDVPLPQWRTMYGVLNDIEAYPVADVKLSGKAMTGYGTPWVSTSDHSWRRHVGHMKARFQKPSRWEQTP